MNHSAKHKACICTRSHLRILRTRAKAEMQSTSHIHASVIAFSRSNLFFVAQGSQWKMSRLNDWRWRRGKLRDLGCDGSTKRLHITLNQNQMFWDDSTSNKTWILEEHRSVTFWRLALTRRLYFALTAEGDKDDGINFEGKCTCESKISFCEDTVFYCRLRFDAFLAQSRVRIYKTLPRKLISWDL